jgi:hypothetical protein
MATRETKQEKPQRYAALILKFENYLPTSQSVDPIDLPAHVVLFSIELSLLALSQVTVVGSHIPLLLVFDVLFFVF